ncbi:CrcB family protein [Streptomyces sp. AJS327]|uniref:fluoride efflux transporter FluC n=1 Tax=Streptomyces sp. AJS327 TaxID=2545265 RepID=UPI0015DDD8CC|nr:CrcB family protein [Streptomyces sp. AJS327]MBA0052954.1 CrcB family protein [Streptomyces sp. AJS327]
MSWLLVIAGGAVGAPLRYLIDGAVRRRWPGVFPWGTLTVNLVGCLLLGGLLGALGGTLGATAPGGGVDLQLLLGVGLCGALTTYSTFSYETLRLARDGAPRLALVNLVTTLTCGPAVYVLAHTAVRAALS